MLTKTRSTRIINLAGRGCATKCGTCSNRPRVAIWRVLSRWYRWRRSLRRRLYSAWRRCRHSRRERRSAGTWCIYVETVDPFTLSACIELACFCLNLIVHSGLVMIFGVTPHTSMWHYVGYIRNAISELASFIANLSHHSLTYFPSNQQLPKKTQCERWSCL